MAAEQNNDAERDQYKFPMHLRVVMERASVVLRNSADSRRRELDEDQQGVIREVLDELERACAESGLCARRSAAIGEGGLVGDLSMLVRQLVHSLKKAKPDSDLAARAVDYLQRKGLAGSPLRAADGAKPVEIDGIKTPEFEGIGEGGLPNLPTLPQSLLNTISDYGMARTDGKSDVERLELWKDLNSAIKHYAAVYGRYAIAADRRARGHAAIQEMVDIAQANDMGYGAPQAAQGVKTWQERLHGDVRANEQPQGAIERAMAAEIADLRAQLARQSQGAIYTCKSKGGTYELLGDAWPAGVLSSTLMVSSYPVYREIKSGRMFVRTKSDFDLRMKLVAAPPLSSEQQALICAKCGANRAISPCGNPSDCGMIGTAYVRCEQQAEKGDK
jgi:hypothetical protein